MTVETGDVDDTSTGTHAAGPRSHETISFPMRLAARLVCVVGDEVGRAYAVGTTPVIIGRSSGADVRINGEDVSRQHARIHVAEQRFVVEDLDSKNGTTVNGLPVRRHALNIGDRIQIGESAIFIFTHTDELEQRAARLQSLDAMSALVGGVVHDFRNLLGAVLANGKLIDILLGDPTPNLAEVKNCTKDIQIAANTGVSLARRLLYFARQRESTGWARVDVANLVTEVLGLLRASLRNQLGLRLDVAIDPVCDIRGDRDEIYHTLVNLCLNARDAMPDGGLLAIRGRTRSLSRAQALQAHLPSAGDYVEIAITDTGCGMDEATLAHIFEPFFTTKGPGQGTGLGLSCAYGVIRNHGGNILVVSTPGKGTSFQLLLPAYNDAPVKESQ